MHKSQWKNIIHAPHQSAHVARCWLGAGEMVDLHNHDFAEIFLVFSGAGWHILEEGKEELSPGMAVMVRRETVHGLKATRDMEYMNIAFPWRVYTDLLARHPQVIEQRVYHVSNQQTEYLIRLAMSLGRDEMSSLRRDQFLLTILQEGGGADEEDALGRCPPWLADTCRQMKRLENFSVGAIQFSVLCGRTPAHVARELKRCTGISPSDMVTANRMQYAAQELRFTRKPITEISLECGYSSLSHFHRTFGKFWGNTALQYRKLNQTMQVE